VGGDRIYLSNPAENQIRVLDASGKLLRIIRTADPLQPLSADEITRRTNAARTSAARSGRPMVAVPTRYAAFSELIVGSDGWLWARENSISRAVPDSWVAFDESGAMIGKLQLPVSAGPGLTPEMIAFGRGTVLLRRWDNDGATYLTLYRLERRS
jgi:hypothetical protein